MSTAACSDRTDAGIDVHRHRLSQVSMACAVLMMLLAGSEAQAQRPLAIDVAPPRHADQVARFMAGLPQEDVTSPYKELETTRAWKQHRLSMDTHWRALEARHLEPMRQWQREDFSAMVDPTLPTFYPFSGPDFVTAHTLYPSAPRYVFVALESVHYPPDFFSMATPTLWKALRGVDRALRDLYTIGYFITSHMDDDLIQRLAEGAMPSIYVMLARTGHELLSAKTVTVTEAGALVEVDDFDGERVHGMRIRFRVRGESTVQEVLYFDVNLKDWSLKRSPGFVGFLRSLQSTNTLVKAASYLMATRAFSTVRSVVVEVSQTLFQDDTGVPLRAFDVALWDVDLFGKYAWPLSGFGTYTHQPELMDLYGTTDPTEIRQLPFTMGYHQYNKGKQSHMLLIHQDRPAARDRAWVPGAVKPRRPGQTQGHQQRLDKSKRSAPGSG